METLSSSLFQQAKQLIPGGVNSPVRACAAVGAEPLFISTGAGSKIQTVDGTTYIDFVQSWGPMLLGHAYPDVSMALHKAVDCGTSFGAPCPDEVTLAKAVNEAMPSMEMIRMVNSGTEATMSAIRLARGYTNRKKIIKFDGGYHGHADSFLANAGSGVATLSIPGTPGVPDAVVADMLIVPYNNLDAVSAIFEANPSEIAAIIVEPCAGNMGLILPKDGFLEGLRTICTNNNALLIFDEVITGFRVSFGGAQKRFSVTPDLTTIGKIIGGGLPVGAYGGKKSIMERIAPSGDIYQAGTLSGNPLAMAAGIATLKAIKNKNYDKLELRVELLCKKLEQIFEEKNIPVKINRIASMFSIFFTSEPVTDFASAKKSDTERYSRFYNHMRDKGIYLAPSAFEVAMVSFAHSDEDFTAMLCAVESFTG